MRIPHNRLDRWHLLLDSLHAMQFRPPPPPQARAGRPQLTSLVGVTMAVRWIPLFTAAYGTVVVRPV
jgi:hypothetical protein